METEIDITQFEEYAKKLKAIANRLKKELEEVDKALKEANEKAIYKYGSLGSYYLRKVKEGNTFKHVVVFKKLLRNEEFIEEDENVKALVMRKYRLMREYKEYAKAYNKVKELLNYYEALKKLNNRL